MSEGMAAPATRLPSCSKPTLSTSIRPLATSVTPPTRLQAPAKYSDSSNLGATGENGSKTRFKPTTYSKARTIRPILARLCMFLKRGVKLFSYRSKKTSINVAARSLRKNDSNLIWINTVFRRRLRLARLF